MYQHSNQTKSNFTPSFMKCKTRVYLSKANHISYAEMKPKFLILIQFDGVITKGQKVEFLPTVSCVWEAERKRILYAS